MLVKILIGVAGVLVLFIAVVATRPSAYHVERKLEVAAPADLVFGVLNDLHQFAGVLVLFGSPWEKLDPAMQRQKMVRFAQRLRARRAERPEHAAPEAPQQPGEGLPRPPR